MENQLQGNDHRQINYLNTYFVYLANKYKNLHAAIGLKFLNNVVQMLNLG